MLYSGTSKKFENFRNFAASVHENFDPFQVQSNLNKEILKVMEFRGLSVMKSYRNQHLASRLFMDCLNIGLSLGCDLAKVDAISQGACRICEKNGFLLSTSVNYEEISMNSQIKSYNKSGKNYNIYVKMLK